MLYLACLAGYDAPARATPDLELSIGQCVARCKLYGIAFVYPITKGQAGLYPVVEARLNSDKTVTVRYL
jgi:hypothetical protein